MNPENFKLELGGHLWYYADLVKNPDSLLEHLTKDVKWVTETYNMFGKAVPTPRLLSSMFDPDIITRDEAGVLHLTKKLKTGKVWRETSSWFQAGGPWTPLIQEFKQDLETFLTEEHGREIKFPYAQLNYYKSGDNYIGYHTDSEVAEDGLIASISLGASRRFVLRDKDKDAGQPNYEFFLEHGSLLVMDCGSGKTYYKHSLPKIRKKDGYVDEKGMGRVNITFRMG